jgi:DNA-binding XRE family transcriptional regulator
MWAKVSRKNSVLREILYRVLERDEWYMTQKSLAQACGVSLDTAHKVVKTLVGFKAVEKKPLGFRVINFFKILQYWACVRDLYRDVVYTTYAPETVSKIESGMPEGVIFTGFSGYAKKFSKSLDYTEVHVYGDPALVQERFKKKHVTRPNIIVIRPDSHLRSVSSGAVVPTGQLYADLWQIGTPKAERLLVEFEEKLKEEPLEKFRAIIEKWRVRG